MVVHDIRYKRTEEALSQYLKEDEFPVLKAKYDIDDNYEELVCLCRSAVQHQTCLG